VELSVAGAVVVVRGRRRCGYGAVVLVGHRRRVGGRLQAGLAFFVGRRQATAAVRFVLHLQVLTTVFAFLRHCRRRRRHSAAAHI